MPPEATNNTAAAYYYSETRVPDTFTFLRKCMQKFFFFYQVFSKNVLL
jgi:hypothetical protein